MKDITELGSFIRAVRIIYGVCGENDDMFKEYAHTNFSDIEGDKIIDFLNEIGRFLDIQIDKKKELVTKIKGE